MNTLTSRAIVGVLALSLTAFAPTEARETFDRGQSAALFVGVQQFTQDPTVAEVRYAVDDAIDLAYVLALDPKVDLVTPSRVILALSGKARKAESRQRLTKLINAGATVAAATQDDVLTLIQRQADRAGRNGVLIVSIASHGFSSDGMPYVLTETSRFEHPETSLSAARVMDIASASRAECSLIFLDVCREPMTSETRGQVVFSAAVAASSAHDDDARRNGVFMGAVMDGLQCKAETDARGLVTVETLSSYVEARVRAWIRMDGDMRTMPLAVCPRR